MPAATDRAVHREPFGSFANAIAWNLRRLRADRGLSMEQLSKLSRVSRAMLGQIEQGRSAPSINTIWKLATALNVPFSALISADQQAPARVIRSDNSKVLTSADGTFVSRALFPVDLPGRVEFYELLLASGSIEEASPHPPGTTENIVVARGKIEIIVEGCVYRLDSGEALFFEADVPHAYRNPGEEQAQMFLVMNYSQTRR